MANDVHKVKTDGYENLDAFLARLSGIACTIPLDRVLQLIGGLLPTAADWWSEPEGTVVDRSLNSSLERYGKMCEALGIGAPQSGAEYLPPRVNFIDRDAALGAPDNA